MYNVNQFIFYIHQLLNNSKVAEKNYYIKLCSNLKQVSDFLLIYRTFTGAQMESNGLYLMYFEK